MSSCMSGLEANGLGLGAPGARCDSDAVTFAATRKSADSTACSALSKGGSGGLRAPVPWLGTSPVSGHESLNTWAPVLCLG